MSYEPTSQSRADSDSSGTHPAGRSRGGFDAVGLARKYPHFQPIGAHAGFPPIPLHRAITLIGSRKSARIHLSSPSVSKAHVLIVVTPHRVYACDLLSREGTFVQGRRINEIELREGDELRVGNFSFTFHDPRPRLPFEPPTLEPVALEVDLPTGPKTLILQKRVTLIGRRPGSDLQLPFSNVSTANTAVVRLEGFAGESDSMAFKGYAVFDLGGKGTMIGRRPVHKNRINIGDEIRIGPAKIRVVSAAVEEAMPAPSARAPAVAPVPAPAFESPATTDDFDEIRLDEGLAEGVEEDVLGGSHVMPAISEPPPERAPVQDREPEAPPVEEPMPFAAEPAIPGDDTVPGFDEGWEEGAAPPAPAVAAGALEDGPVDEWGEANEPFPLEDAVLEPSAWQADSAASDEAVVPLAGEEEPHAAWPGPGESDHQVGVVDEAHPREAVGTGGSVVEFSISDSFAGDEHETVHGASGSVIDATIEEPPARMPREADEPGSTEPALDEFEADEQTVAPEVEPRWPEEEPYAAGDAFAEAEQEPATPLESEDTRPDWAHDEAPAEANEAVIGEQVAEPVAARWPADEGLPGAEESAVVAEPLEEAVEPNWSAEAFASQPEEPAAVAGPDLDAEEAETPPTPVALGEPGEDSRDIDLSQLDFSNQSAAVEELAEAGPEADEPDEAPIREPIMPPAEPAAPPVERPARSPRRKGTGRRKPDRTAPGIAAMFEPEAFAEPVGSAELTAAEAAGNAESELEAVPMAGEVETPVSPIEIEPIAEPVAEVPPEAALDSSEDWPVAAKPKGVPDEPLGAIAADASGARSAAGGSSVSDVTESSPESALDLSELDLAAADAPPLGEASLLSDSAFALQLEAMTDADAGDLVSTAHPQSQPEPIARQPEAEPTKEEPNAAAPPQPAAVARWRDEWAKEASAFLGNLTPLDPTPSLPVTTPRRPIIAPQQPAARKAPAPEPHEQAPEGLGQDYATRQHERAPQQRPRHGKPQALPSNAPAPPARSTPTHSSQPAAEPVGAGTPEPPRQKSAPRPKVVGFGGAVAEVDQAAARDARNPFSSAPIASGGGDPASMLDPSAVIPETSGLVGFAEVQGVAPGRAPVMTPAPGPGDEAKTGQARAEGSANARLIPDSVEAGALDDDIIDEQARVDEFVRTIRGGLGRAQAPAPIRKDQNGHAPNGFQGGDAADLLMRGGAESIHAHPGRGTALMAEAAPVELPRRRRSTWLIPLLIGLMVAAMIGAVAGIYYGMQPTVPVTLKLRYDVPPALMEQEQALALHRKEQLDLLRYDDAVRQGALDVLQRTSPTVPPAYLNDLQAFNSFAHNDVQWHDSELNTMVLRREVSEGERQAEMARLKAVGLAMYDQGGTARATRDLLSGEARQLEDEIAKLLRESQAIGSDIEELLASLPRAGGDEAERTRQEEELVDRIATLDKEWNAADRRVGQLRAQLTTLESGNPLSGDEQLAELKRRLVDIEARLASAGQGDAADQEEAEPAGSPLAPATGEAREGAPAIVKVTEELPRDARILRALIEERMQRVTEVADAAGAGEGETALMDGVVELNRLTAQLVDEIVPRHVLKAGEVEMLHQALLRTRRQRMVERLDADESIRTLRGEVALKERELGAAISDGLTDKATGLRMALRISRDRLTLRTSQIEAALAQDPDVVDATRSYETARDEALKTLREQREAFERELGARRQTLLATAERRAMPSLARAIAELDNAVAAFVHEKTQGLAVSAQVWAPAETENEPAVEETPAAEEEPELSSVEEVPQWVALFEAEAQDDPPASQPVSLEAQADELRRRIREREASLREAHATRLAELRQQVAAAEALSAKAQSEAQQARAQLTNLQAGEQATERDRQRLAQMRLDKHDKDTLLEEKRAELARTRTAGGALPTPLAPTDADIDAPLHVKDDRPLVMVAALLGILAIFLVPLYFTMRSDTRR